MYLGTKLKFRASMIPTSFKDDSFEEFKDYKKVERKVLTIPREEVSSKTSDKTLKAILSYIKKELENSKTESYGVIKLIETNTAGNNTLLQVEPSLLITLYLYSKPKKKEVVKEKTK
jgi:hypothetical protein